MNPEPGPAAQLGPLIVVTDRTQAEAAGHHLVDLMAGAVEAGARTVLLREKDLPRDERIALARAVAELLAPVDGTLLVASDAHLAGSVGAAGVHLAAADPDVARSSDRAPPAVHPGAAPTAARSRRRLVVGRSCHSVAELGAAEAEGAGYVTYSPVWATASKPGHGPALGPDGLAHGAAVVPGLPVYALGGIEPGRAAPCRAAGAAGVAVMGAVMRAADPASVVRALLDELADRASSQPRPSRSNRLA